MCGIYGSTINYSKKDVELKLKQINFRGPDYTGISSYNTDNTIVTLGHNRLAILDLEARSNQPFTYNNSLHIVFNGEIYNHLDIKEVLVKKGHTFKTTSDTEVICAAYLEYGKNCVDYFNGMFAFAIFDQSNKIIFGARDRLGKKPFYYYHNGKEFEFASQISAIQLSHSNLTISQSSITHYLTLGTIPDPHSIFNEVKKIKAGHTFTFNLVTEHFEQKPYWDIDRTIQNKFVGSYSDAKQELEKVITDAVKIRLFADVPVGVFLSGGVDSSLVAALAKKNSTEKVNTFSVKFNVKGFDESQFAQKVANHLQTEHHIIECDYNEGINLIKKICDFYDEPFADASAVPSLLLAKHTKQHVTVALSGDGGDEGFLGYHRYNWIKYAENLYKLPNSSRLMLSKILSMLPHYKYKMIGNVLKSDSLNNAYLAMIGGNKKAWVEENIDFNQLPEYIYLDHSYKNIYERISDYDIKTYLNWDINTKVDRASMAYSLETRAPLLDYRVIDFSRSIPTEYKFAKNNQKRILKDILYDHVPKEFFDRPKSGFTIPFKEWFRSDLKDFVLSELDEGSLKNIPGIKIDEVQKCIQQHMTGNWNRYPMIWNLLILKQWLTSNGAGFEIR